MDEYSKVEKQLNALSPEFLKGVVFIRDALLEIKDDHPWGNDLCGACGVSAYLVFRYAQRFCLNTVFVCSCGHCYTLVDDCVVDATAIQFNSSFLVRDDLELSPFFNKDRILLASGQNYLVSVGGYAQSIYESSCFLTYSDAIFKKLIDWDEQNPYVFLQEVKEEWLRKVNDKLGLCLQRPNKEDKCA